MSADWPNMEAVSIKIPNRWLGIASPMEIGIVYRLIMFISAQAVNTYTSADVDPRLPGDDDKLRRIAFCSKAEWRRFKPLMGEFFAFSDGAWRLRDDDVIRLSRPSVREAISTAAKSAALSREGRRCAYCGDLDGPFHFDHLFPVSRGGSNAANNIVLACAACNLSKSDRTLAEWVAR